MTEEGKKIRQSKVRVDIDDRSFYGIGNTFKLAKKAAAIEALFNAYKVKYEEPGRNKHNMYTCNAFLSIEQILDDRLREKILKP